MMTQRWWPLLHVAALILASNPCTATGIRIASVDVPSAAINVVSEVRSEFLVVGYQQGENVLVRGIALSNNVQWTKEFQRERLNSIDVDDTGETVVVFLVSGLLEESKSVVLRNGSEVFSHEGEDLVRVSPNGQYFYLHHDGPTAGLLDVKGQGFSLPGDLGRHAGNYSFAGKNHLLAAIWDLAKMDQGLPMQGTLALVRLPTEIVWEKPIPSEFRLGTGRETSIAIGESLLVVGEYGLGGRIMCFDGRGQALWEYRSTSGIKGLAILDRSWVIVAQPDAFLALDAKENGRVFEVRPLSTITSVKEKAILAVTEILVDDSRVIFNLKTDVRGQRSLGEESVEVRSRNGTIDYGLVQGFSEVALVEKRLVGIRGENAATVVEVPTQ